MLLPHALFHAGLLAFVTPVSAQLPYNPTRIIPTENGEIAYIFSPQPSSSQFSLYSLDISHGFNSTSTKDRLSETLPFLSETTPEAFIAIPDDEGITVLAGDCNNSTKEIGLWRLGTKGDGKNSTWTQFPLSTSDASLRPRYLSAGFSFSPTDSSDDVSVYVFGGMCPDTSTPNTADWVSDATYSNTMLTLAPSSESSSSSPYQLSLTGARAPPIAEAGLTITPLTPIFSNTSETSVSQQQNVVLLGGHTQTAFINMSQLAIFSLPQESWAFVGAAQPTDGTTVEPRSGHTAILTPDGSRIIVVGGWVGDISTPAQPQLVVLEVGQGYGGGGAWRWTAPSASSNPFSAGSGVYGHGAALLPGDVMVISGGFPIGKSGTRKRDGTVGDMLFLNTTTMSWTSTYTNPYPSGSPTAAASSNSSSGGLRPAEKAGLGAGLGLGIAAAAGVAIVWLLYSRKLQQKRAVREKELREQALGSRFQSPTPPHHTDRDAPSFRSASWGAMQEKHIESSGNPYPWAPVTAPGDAGKLQMPSDEDGNYSKLAERTGVLMEVPSPTRGLRRSLSNRAPLGFGPFNQHPPTGVPGPVFRIDEEDEGSQSGFSRRAKGLQGDLDRNSIQSNPFKDPVTAVEDPAAQRRKEVEGWVEDWQSAAESFSVSRNTSQAHSRTHSNLSQFRPPTTAGDHSGRGSPEKSDRTGSNLSDSSAFTSSSLQRSMAGTISRNVSQRSVSAGYALFAGAAAAMSRFGGGRTAQNESLNNGGLARAPSNRSVSLNTDSAGRPNASDNADRYAFARGNPWGPVTVGENQGLLKTRGQPQVNRSYKTLPENTLADRYARAGSLSGTTRKAMNLLGSMRRVFTGTGNVDVQERVGALEDRSTQSSPTKRAEMRDVAPSRTLSAGASSFWQGKRGAKDWDEDLPDRGEAGPSSVQRKPVPRLAIGDNNQELDDDDDDWDVETAVQKRVVQVMFTVPKEKLRVVNADALSLLSSNRSEADHEEDKEREHVKRMSSVREGDDEDYEPDDPTTQTKGKEREH
ncbi:uncharacterized protein PV06_01947 [Exophiala oligosperma]|uniref:Galactose oxidase-like Early set domain-containing protein n=1 Tax=Exophiala oligosperma TaxID=215243 RepID=A0A0D2B260_9EURO|nr:uncharacterized protein PV06_01947 [Exophiala oligosperma]KIW46266.1 hypothetical protein PV06_01947 [Exophiala oligosperma]